MGSVVRCFDKQFTRAALTTLMISLMKEDGNTAKAHSRLELGFHQDEV